MVVNFENSQKLMLNFKQVNSQSTRGSKDIEERMEGKYKLEGRRAVDVGGTSILVNE